MSKEIEYKFLVTNKLNLPLSHDRSEIVQGYMNTTYPTIRVRTAIYQDSPLGDDTKTAYLTIKGHKTGLSCDEFEYEIPFEDGAALLQTCYARIKKTRYYIPHGDRHTIELDVFHGDLEGLVIAEIEVESESDTWNKVLPGWIGKDVSADFRYSNAVMATEGIPK